MMKFIFPCVEYEQKAIEFILEFHDNMSLINGTGGLDGMLRTGTYSDWLEKVLRILILRIYQEKEFLHSHTFMSEKRTIGSLE